MIQFENVDLLFDAYLEIKGKDVTEKCFDVAAAVHIYFEQGGYAPEHLDRGQIWTDCKRIIAEYKELLTKQKIAINAANKRLGITTKPQLLA